MSPEDARRGELTELVADEVLRDVHGDPGLAVVHGDRVADHLGDDRGSPREGLHHALLAALVHVDNLLVQALRNERSLLYGS